MLNCCAICTKGYVSLVNKPRYRTKVKKSSGPERNGLKKTINSSKIFFESLPVLIVVYFCNLNNDVLIRYSLIYLFDFCHRFNFSTCSSDTKRSFWCHLSISQSLGRLYWFWIFMVFGKRIDRSRLNRFPEKTCSYWFFFNIQGADKGFPIQYSSYLNNVDFLRNFLNHIMPRLHFCTIYTSRIHFLHHISF